MKSLKSILLVMIMIVFSLTYLGCKGEKDQEHPQGEHPQGEHPAAMDSTHAQEHPQGGHPAAADSAHTQEHPQSEHPQGEHPKSQN